jgi:hypothetical protein
MSYADQLAALKELVTRMNKKEDIPDDLWIQAALSKGTKLKDITKAIEAIKKNISSETKEKTNEAIADEAKKLGVTFEEAAGKNVKQAKKSDGRQDKDVLKQQVLAERELKSRQQLADSGEMDMQCDYV